MYGYIRTDKPELKIKDYENYRAVYCSLCKALGRRYGLAARLFLSYDVTFYALFALSLSALPCSFTLGRCPFNPAKKCAFCKDHEVLNFSADLSIVLIYYKAKDTLQDGSFFKKIIVCLFLPYLTFLFRKAKKRIPEICERARRYINAQYRAEISPCAGIDSACEPSAIFFSELAGDIPTEEKENLRRFGFMLGRFVYLADALDDLKKDIKNHNFNPFVKEYELNGEISEEIFDKIAESIEFTIAEINDSFQKLPIENYRSILENIVRLGLYQQIEIIREKYFPEEKE